MDNNKRVASFTSDIRNLLAKYYLIPSVIVFVLLLFIIFLLYGYSFYFTAQQEGKNASEDLETIVTSYLDGLSILINNQTFIDLLEDKGKQAESARILYDFVNSQDVGSDFFVLDVAGKARVGSSTILGSYLSSPPPYYSGFLYRLQQQPHNKTVMLSLLSEGRANSMVLSVGQAILKDGHIIGYLVFELSPTELLRTIFPGEVGELVVTNTFYTALISSNNLYVDKYSKLYSEYRVANSKYVKHQDKHYFITREYNQTLDMYLFVLVEISTIGRVILFTAGILLFIFLGAMSVLLLATTHVVKLETMSIDTLFANISKMQKEGIYVETEQRSGGFKSLELTYAALIQQIRKLVEENKLETELRKTAEIRQLESQFNPHFIFNTLELIRCLMKDDIQVASRMILTFAEILRYSIETSRKQVPLADDLYYVDCYLSLHTMYSNRLKYSIHIDEQVKEVEIPKLCIQPLIENAVKYGQIKKELFVEISVTVSSDILNVYVKDDGPGIPEKRLADIRQALLESQPSNRYFGLTNVHRRLVLQYGLSSGLKIESSKKGTCVSFSIPFNHDDLNDKENSYV